MRYAQILPTFWTRGSGKRLRGKKAAQVLALYLMTCPACNLIGLYYQAKITICHETGLAPDEFEAALAELDGIAHYDPEIELVWVPALPRYQIGESLGKTDKRRTSILRELKILGVHSFVSDFHHRYDRAYGLTSPCNVPPKPLISPTDGGKSLVLPPCTDLLCSDLNGEQPAHEPDLLPAQDRPEVRAFDGQWAESEQAKTLERAKARRERDSKRTPAAHKRRAQRREGK